MLDMKMRGKKVTREREKGAHIDFQYLIMSSISQWKLGMESKVVYYQNKQISNLSKTATQEYQLGESHLRSKQDMGKHRLCYIH